MQNQGFLPTRIVAGETIWISASNTAQGSSDIVLSDFAPSDGSTLQYQFAGTTPTSVDAAANGDDSGWTLVVSATETLTWKAGVVKFAAYVTKDGKVYAVDAGAIDVTASPLATSTWTAVITAVDAAILSYAASPHGSFSIDGMQFSFRSMNDLRKLREFAVAERDKELGSRPKRIIRSRFT